jgi:hypothetical protein
MLLYRAIGSVLNISKNLLLWMLIYGAISSIPSNFSRVLGHHVPTIFNYIEKHDTYTVFTHSSYTPYHTNGIPKPQLSTPCLPGQNQG